MLAAEDQGDLVVEVPLVPHRVDLLAGQMADAALAVEDAHTDAIRDFLVVGLADPFRDAAHRLLHHLPLARSVAPEAQVVLPASEARMKETVALRALNAGGADALLEHLGFHLHAVGQRRHD
ncbi:hypothetical protein [Sinorhizobium fredii]|uniref:hypothetical protein n=1 Tax=Rhizobium fredii TaxID=380 RepID=UPI0035145402